MSETTPAAGSAPVVFISGGAGNLGRAVTRELLASGWRAAVALHAKDAQHALDPHRAEFGDRLHTFLLDLTTERGAASAIRQTVEWGGRLDAVAHLMGGWAGGAKLAETDVGTWDHMMDLNLKSAWLVARAAVPPMVERGGGSLVFVASRAARERRAGNGAYAIAKAGVCVLAETLAEEYRLQGVRASAVLPGTIDTPANRAAMPEADASRWTPPEEIARVIHFLASPASAAVSGARVPVYGRS